MEGRSMMDERSQLWEQFKDADPKTLLTRNVNRVIECIERQETMKLEQFMDALNGEAKYPRASIRISRYCKPNQPAVWYMELLISNFWAKDKDGWYKQTYVVSDYFADPIGAMPWRSSVKTKLLAGIDYQAILQEVRDADRAYKQSAGLKKAGK